MFFAASPAEAALLSIGLSVVGGLMLGILAALIIFRRRAQKAVYAQMEGQVGAAAGALGLLKRGWQIDPAIAFTKQQDVVHRVVGPPGIVLVGEGNPNRLRPCWPASGASTSAWPRETPIHEIVVGNDEGQVPLPKLVAPRQKLQATGQARRDDRHPRPAQGDRRPRARSIPMPKGPVPTSMKGLRGNMRGR